LVTVAVDAGFDAKVPTCPAWNVRALVAHQAMVHRWATAHVRGDDPDAVPNQTWIRANVEDLAGYYTEGHAALVDALRAAPPDLVALSFLNDAPPPRAFWARRQAHETAIHMVDALAAARSDDLGIDGALAVDGIDELLAGFFTRGTSKRYGGEPYTILVTATDAERSWLLHVGPTLTVTPDPEDAAAAATLRGTAVALYLGLWNRGDDVTLDGRPDVLERWRSTQRVRWS
jgi:uncharacterized protein (TIGR03083 family)